MESDPLYVEARRVLLDALDGLRRLEELFGRAGRPGIAMAIRALRGVMAAARVEALCVSYTRSVIAAL